jgi:hypothetical protein
MAFSTASGTFQTGDGIYIQFQTTNRTVSPPSLGDVTSATVSIVRPDGTLAVNAAAATHESLGTYSYVYASQATDQLGNWEVNIVATATVNSVPVNSVLNGAYIFTLLQ